MAIKSSGTQLSFTEIEQEFGSNGERSLGDYRLTQNVGELSGLPLDNGIPTGSNDEIKFSDFYGKKLNVVVDCFSGGDEFHKNAKNDKWNNNNVTVIGGFRSKKESGSKIIIHVNKKFGSDKNNVNRCALRTGSWSSIDSMQIDVGSSGRCLGAGGNGGNGAVFNNDDIQVNGFTGTSGLGVEVNNTVVNVVSGGILRAGFGGGGGGGAGRQTDKGEDRKSSGGGGGGGQGFPGGLGGIRGSTSISNTQGQNTNGSAGDESEAGEGGNGSQNASEAYGGAGGEGGSFGEGANAGSGGAGKQTEEAGSGGGDGAALRRTSGFAITINNSGTIQGSTSATTVD
tara:strand:+ start:1280 stop:2302 length:1023 start_codon:yes stop_codon:yes gene_type:complete